MPNRTDMDHYELWIFMAKNKMKLEYDSEKNNIHVLADGEMEVMDLPDDHAFMFSENVLPCILKLRRKLIAKGTLIE